MPAPTPCPISEVDRALSSYINTREETLKIRRTISSYLTTSLRPVNPAVKTHHLNHECPQEISTASTNPPGLKGSRLEYLQALRARHQAQSKRRELQASLEGLQQKHVEEYPMSAQPEHGSGTTESYVTLLRQRRCLAELQVIQDALDKLLTSRPSTAPRDPKMLIMNTLGEQPDLPAERLEQLSKPQDNDLALFKLKQEVLDARTSMERATAARKQVQGRSNETASLQQQVRALERARDEIVDWVQAELAKMEEDSIFLEDASPMKRLVKEPSPMDVASAEERIRGAYNQYTESRAGLIDGYRSLEQPALARANGHDESASITQDTPGVQSMMPQLVVTKLLSHLPHLAQAANHERSLLQQSVYLQTQITSADQEIEETLLRLSGESHLLPTGSKDVTAWGKTAAEAETATKNLVENHLQSSRQEAGSVSTIMELCSLQSKVLSI
jgi:hypothetical protein